MLAKLIILFKQYWLTVTLLLIGLHISFFQIFGYDLRNTIGDLGDSRFIMSIVEYNYQWALGNYDSYWDGFFMFPDKEVISYSDNLLGAIPFYAVFRLAGFDYSTAFQLFLLLCSILNFTTAHFALQRLTKNVYAAAVGAFIFAFSLALNGIHNHPQFTFRFAIPLFFLFIYQYFLQKKYKYLLYASLALLVQFYLGIYLGYFTVFFGILLAIGFALVHFRTVNFASIKKLTLHFFFAGITTGIGILPLFYFYLKRNKITGYYTSFEQVLETVPQPASYLKSFPKSILWDFLSSTSVHSKFEWFHFLFPGLIVIIGIFAGFYLIGRSYNRGLIISILFVIVATFILTTNFNGHSLYDNIVLRLPGFKAIRVVSRLILVFIFFPAWLLAENLSFLSKQYNKAFKLLVFLMPVFLFFDNYCDKQAFNTFKKEESNTRVQLIVDKVKSTPNYQQYSAFAYVTKSEEPAYRLQIDAMLAAVNLKMKTVNGYSSSCHGKFGPFWEMHDSLHLANWLRDMNFDSKKVLVVQ